MGGGRCESRNADSACNPYLAATLALAAGLEGVREKLDPGSPQDDNLYELDEAELASRGIQYLPRNLEEAVEAFAADPSSSGPSAGAPGRIHRLQARGVGHVPPAGQPMGGRPLCQAVLSRRRARRNSP